MTAKGKGAHLKVGATNALSVFPAQLSFTLHASNIA